MPRLQLKSRLIAGSAFRDNAFREPQARAWTGILAAMAALALAASPSVAQTTRPGASGATKAVLVASERLDLQVEARKPHYDVNEEITLRVTLSRPAFVYFYSREKDETVRLLSPSSEVESEKLDKGTQILRRFLVVDTPGTAEIVAFASERSLNLLAGGLPPRGEARMPFEEKLAGLGVNVGSAAKAEAVAGISAPKVLNLTIGDRVARPDAPPATPPVTPPPVTPPAVTPPAVTAVVTPPVPPAVVTPPVTPVVTPPAGPVVTPPATPVVVTPPAGKPATGTPEASALALVSTDKAVYKSGEDVQLVYGVSQPGFAHLFVVYPDGTIEELTKDRFDVAGTKTVAATAEKPFGEQSVVAVYSKDGALSVDEVRVALKANASGLASKGLALRDAAGAPRPVTIRNLTIKE